MRYKFYREHKYVSFALNDLERQIAKTNFRSLEEIKSIKSTFEKIVEMLKGHAEYENTSLHELLKKKQSSVYAHVEEDHHHYDDLLNDLIARLEKTLHEKNEDARVEAGYQFYLWYRKFVGENLLHLHEEETVILPELQRLYTDEELKTVEASTYKSMTASDLIDMMQILFPHMNLDDKEAFLTDIKECQKENFSAVWLGIQSQLTLGEQETLLEKLNLQLDLENTLKRPL